VIIGAINKSSFSSNYYLNGILDTVRPLGERQAKLYGVPAKQTTIKRVQEHLPYPVAGVLNFPGKQFDQLLRTPEGYKEIDTVGGICLIGKNENASDIIKRPGFDNYIQSILLNDVSEIFGGNTTMIIPDNEYSNSKTAESLGLHSRYHPDDVTTASDMYAELLKKVAPKTKILRTSEHAANIDERIKKLKDAETYDKLVDTSLLYYNNIDDASKIRNQKELIVRYGVIYANATSLISGKENGKHPLLLLFDSAERPPAEVASILQRVSVVGDFGRAYTWNNITDDERRILNGAGSYFIPHTGIPGLNKEIFMYDETPDNKLFISEELSVSENKLKKALDTKEGKNAVEYILALLPRTDAKIKTDALNTIRTEGDYSTANELIMKEMEVAHRLIK